MSTIHHQRQESERNFCKCSLDHGRTTSKPRKSNKINAKQSPMALIAKWTLTALIDAWLPSVLCDPTIIAKDPERTPAKMQIPLELPKWTQNQCL
jgi:hypothetical protein